MSSTSSAICFMINLSIQLVGPRLSQNSVQKFTRLFQDAKKIILPKWAILYVTNIIQYVSKSEHLWFVEDRHLEAGVILLWAPRFTDFLLGIKDK